MQVSERSEELYDKLAKEIKAKDDAAARRGFREVLNNGFSRQEIVLRVSHLIEQRSAGKIGGTDKIGWLNPHLPIEPSVSEGGRKTPNASANTSRPNAYYIHKGAEKSPPSHDIGSERSPLSVPERLAAKLQLLNEVKPAEAIQGIPAEIEAQQTASAEGAAREIVRATAEAQPMAAVR